MRKAESVLAVLAAALLLFSGCGKKASASPPGNAERAAGVERITIYFIPKNLGNPYFDALSSGFHNAIAQLGEDNFRYVYTGPDTAEAASQIPYVEEALRDGAGAIFIAANSNNALNGLFDRAREQGVRIYIINQDIPGSESHRDAAIMPVDFNTIGASLMDLMGSQIEYEGQFAILSATADAPDQNTWIDLMKAEFGGNPKYRRMELAEIVYGDDNTEGRISRVSSLLPPWACLRSARWYGTGA
jgi:rhamnose transport system substrate-binding protein